MERKTGELLLVLFCLGGVEAQLSVVYKPPYTFQCKVSDGFQCGSRNGLTEAVMGWLVDGIKFWGSPDRTEIQQEAGVDVDGTVLDISRVSTSVTRIQCACFTYYDNIGDVIVNSTIVYLRVTRMVVSEVGKEDIVLNLVKGSNDWYHASDSVALANQDVKEENERLRKENKMLKNRLEAITSVVNDVYAFVNNPVDDSVDNPTPVGCIPTSDHKTDQHSVSDRQR